MDPTGVWQQNATELTKEMLEKMGRYMERGTDEDDSPLAPLRRAIGGIADLGEVITELEAEPSEDKLRLLGRELNQARGSLMSLGQVLTLSQDPTLTASAHQPVTEAEEAIRGGQQRVRAASKGWELHRTSWMLEVWTCLLLVTARWRSHTSGGQGSEMVDLIHCLSGAQANDSV